ncbi:phage tail protein [Aminobacterium sp. EBM-42]|jgi:phage protein U|uniref:phage tail protein n=1 Tax=Aminobacterium sp. EBM-42 TaxID=1918503 RepID=UPI001BCE8ABC|nr:phage tail protein [Aminobacterium sp. EBM-42]
MIGSFDDVVFETSADKVRTPENFQRQGAARFGTHEVAGQKPVLEFMGPGLDSVTMTICFRVALGVNPRVEIDRLREMRDDGIYAPLILAGRPLGTFVIESINETWSQIDNHGRLLRATVDLTLREYVEE